MIILNEVKSSTIIKRSKEKTPLSRYSRRLTVGDVSIDRIGVAEILNFGQKDLTLYFEVHGHQVSLRLLNFLSRLRSLYKNQYSKIASEGGAGRSSTFRKLAGLVLDSLLKNGDIEVDCDCGDWEYRFAYVATMRGYKMGTPQDIPAEIRNPRNQGGACKHILRVLTSPSSWKEKALTGIVSIIRSNPHKILDQ